MKCFAALIDRLIYTRSRNSKLALIVDYLRHTPDPDRGWGLAALFWAVSLPIRAQARRAGVRYRFLFMRPDGEGLALLARLIDEGRLRTTTDRVFPLDEAPAAMAYLEAGRAKGKVVLSIT